MSIPTNVLALPVADAVMETGTNEDWIDCFVYYVDDGTTTPPQLDLRGIDFELEVRRTPPDNEVILMATTKNGSILRGFPPNVGYLIFNISDEAMASRSPGTYVGELRADDGIYRRVTIHIDLTIQQGITR
jgi:hypothetical protein